MQLRSLLSLLILFAVTEFANDGEIEKIDGYGGYKFGMTLEEADAVRPDDVRQSECKYPGVSLVCLKRQTTLYGEEAEIVVIFSQQGQRVERVQINFFRMTENSTGACRSVLKAIAEPLLKTFGTKYLRESEDNLKITWHLPKGGKVVLRKLCVDADFGVVTVTYSPSDAF